MTCTSAARKLLQAVIALQVTYPIAHLLIPYRKPVDHSFDVRQQGVIFLLYSGFWW